MELTGVTDSSDVSLFQFDDSSLFVPGNCAPSGSGRGTGGRASCLVLVDMTLDECAAVARSTEARVWLSKMT